MLKEISIEVIRKCPNSCMHCSSLSSSRCTEIITFEKFIEVVDGASILGVKTICFSGGEPFLHPDIVKMVKYVSSKNIKSFIYTSGISFDSSERYISLPSDILSSIAGYVTKLIFNIEAATEKTYDLIMGTTGCYSLLKESALNAAANNILTEAHFVPMRLNLNELDETVKLCADIKIKKISFLRLVLHGRATQNSIQIKLLEEEENRLREKLEFLNANNTIDIRVGVPLSNGNSKNKCEAANGKLNIKYDGGVYPCEVFKNNSILFKPGIAVPNIFSEDIVSIYNNSKYLKAVRNYIKYFSCNASCENCVGQYLIDTKEEVGETDG